MISSTTSTLSKQLGVAAVILRPPAGGLLFQLKLVTMTQSRKRRHDDRLMHRKAPQQDLLEVAEPLALLYTGMIFLFASIACVRADIRWLVV
jgi:hypothetical protein